MMYNSANHEDRSIYFLFKTCIKIMNDTRNKAD